MADYDIGKAFEEIEDNLIDSMVRNLRRHKVEETKLGFEWSQWQVAQLQSLEDYRKRNQAKFPKQFDHINQQIRQVMKSSYNDGATKQERKILQAIKRGFKLNGTNAPNISKTTEITAEFFKTNDNKLNALIQATTHDMAKAETAVLRMVNDQYRKTIFNAQVYANTGAGTYEQAVDMATKDFLSAGINCIEYRNGRRVNVRSYAEMALRTASKRAYLQGEGDKRKEWGVHTVILNKRSNPCPLCAPFVGKVFIDDVWSGGTADEAKEKGYPLLSDAIAQGLYHPNCRDSHTTYFEDISTLSEDSKYTADELDEMAENYNNQQKVNYAENEAKRMTRMSKYSLDKDNQRLYGERAKQWEDKADSLSVHKISDVDKAGESAEEIAKTPKTVAKTIEKPVESGIISYEYSKNIKKTVIDAFDAEYTAMTEKFGKITTISRIEPLLNGTDYGEYYDHSGILSIRFANKKDCLSLLAQKAVEMKKAGKWSSAHPMHVLRHEIGHAIQAEHAKTDPLWGDKLKKIQCIVKSLPESQGENITGQYSVSKYAMRNLDEFISECIAESMTRKARKTAKNIVNIILGG